jgi:hypothetical protein
LMTFLEHRLSILRTRRRRDDRPVITILTVGNTKSI